MICDECLGEGYIEEDGHRIMCEKCIGLGSVFVEPEESKPAQFAEKRRPLMNSVYVLIAAMTLYYLFFLVIQHIYNFSLITSILVLLVGHLTGVGGFLLYILWATLTSRFDS